MFVKKNKPLITVLIVNFNSATFTALSLYSLSRLTRNSYKVHIVDNGSGRLDYQDLIHACKMYTNVKLEKWETNLRGSMAHASALNHMIDQVDTKYFVTLDADATFLIKGWDEIMVDKINELVKVIGTQAPPPKFQDFPLMFATLFETAKFKELIVSFNPDPQDPSKDTGWEIRDKYLQAGFKGDLLSNKNTRNYKQGPFSELIVAEYYLSGYDHIFASHFGRGSTLGRTKYLKDKKINCLNKQWQEMRIKQIGRKEKFKWLSICRQLIDQQMILDTRYQELSHCPVCQSGYHNSYINSIDRISQKPGIFYLRKCRSCLSVFQSPRIKEKYIDEFYPDSLGYYQKPDTVKSSIFKINLWHRLYRKFFTRRWNAIHMIVDANVGKMLDIGSGNGMLLEKYKDKGWSVLGIEPNEAAAKKCQKKNIEVKVGKFSDMAPAGGNFDLITMSMVLEHLYYPILVLKKINFALKPDGILFFSIPYIYGFEFRLFREYSYGLHLPHHQIFFSKKAIKEILHNTGFSDIHIYYQFFDRDIVASAWYKYIETTNNFYRHLAFNQFFRNFILPFLLIFFSFLGLTSRITIKAKKK